MMRLVEKMPRDAILVEEGLTTTTTLFNYFPFRDRNSYFGNVSGGIGWGIAAAVGVQIAHPARRVVAVIGDGSAMYSITALWSAANQKLPVVFVITNNEGYQILKNRLKLFHGNDTPIDMDFNDPPMNINYACPIIWKDHRECYHDCGCASEFIDYLAFNAVCKIALPCAVDSAAINLVNRCMPATK